MHLKAYLHLNNIHMNCRTLFKRVNDICAKSKNEKKIAIDEFLKDFLNKDFLNQDVQNAKSLMPPTLEEITDMFEFLDVE